MVNFRVHYKIVGLYFFTVNYTAQTVVLTLNFHTCYCIPQSVTFENYLTDIKLLTKLYFKGTI